MRHALGLNDVHRRVIVGGSLALMLALPGCFSHSPGDAASRLADFATCGFRYPDNRSVDCRATEAVSFIDSTSVPPGFHCVDQVPPMGYEGQTVVKVWRGPNGDYGIELIANERAGGGAEVFGSLDLVNPSHHYFQLVRTGPHAFIPIPLQAFSGTSGGFTTKFYAFKAAGTPEVFQTAHLEMMATQFDGNAWYVWNFDGGQVHYFFQQMDALQTPSATFWSPSSFKQVGSDFELNASASRLGIYGGNFVDQDPSPNPLQPSQPKCPA